MKKYAVIVAGGSGSRMGGGMPKQFRSLCGHPVLWWSMKAFHDEDPDTCLILVLPQDFINLWKDFFDSLPESERFAHEVTTGGDSRFQSVKNGLELIEDDQTLVAVHDGARPLVTPRMITRGWEKAAKEGGAIPVVPVTDSLRHLEAEGNRSVDRSEFVAVQTPQVFKTGLLKEAYRKVQTTAFTDDASVMENAGHKIAFYDGSPENIKITNPKDMAVAAVLMGKNA